MNEQKPTNIIWDAANVHFGEIALKRGNRKTFIEKLETNIRRRVKPMGVSVTGYHDRVMLTGSPDAIENGISAASKIAGVQYVVPVRKIEPSIDAMKGAALEFYQQHATQNASFSVRVRRANKQFPMKSHEIECAIGDIIDAPVNLSNPDVTIAFRLHREAAYLEGVRIPGPHGLPCGIAGKALMLFSGGIDSPVAAWMMMKRGCRLDFIHYHTFAEAQDIRSSKIPDMLRTVTVPQAMKARLFLVPYLPFDMGLTLNKIPRDMELIMFRRYMARVSSIVAMRHHHSALISGDNLAQVASQTLENIIAFDDVTKRTIFRPLVGLNKDDIIKIAKDIGTYELSIQQYKDCCSLAAPHPCTRPSLQRVRETEKELPIDEMVQQAIDSLEIIHFGPDGAILDD